MEQVIFVMDTVDKLFNARLNYQFQNNLFKFQQTLKLSLKQLIMGLNPARPSKLKMNEIHLIKKIFTYYNHEQFKIFHSNLKSKANKPFFAKSSTFSKRQIFRRILCRQDKLRPVSYCKDKASPHFCRLCRGKMNANQMRSEDRQRKLFSDTPFRRNKVQHKKEVVQHKKEVQQCHYIVQRLIKQKERIEKKAQEYFKRCAKLKKACLQRGVFLKQTSRKYKQTLKANEQKNLKYIQTRVQIFNQKLKKWIKQKVFGLSSREHNSYIFNILKNSSKEKAVSFRDNPWF